MPKTRSFKPRNEVGKIELEKLGLKLESIVEVGKFELNLERNNEVGKLLLSLELRSVLSHFARLFPT